MRSTQSQGDTTQNKGRLRTHRRRSRALPETSTSTARHTTHPPVPCLGRPLSIENVGKGQGRLIRASAAPPGGRFWHGFAVRRQPAGRGGRGLTFGRLLGKCARSNSEQNRLAFDQAGMKRKPAPSPAFFTERTLADYLAVSDRTIRNWIRRGDLPSYKLGAARRIDPADVEDFLARHLDEAA